mmetsp:Transcript_18066/g.51722  ORF Transcript_18066/g.51722 Transcript_18066/m.51722 type:complete len:210 (-) Transcript_18066:918-1547(-)
MRLILKQGIKLIQNNGLQSIDLHPSRLGSRLTDNELGDATWGTNDNVGLLLADGVNASAEGRAANGKENLETGALEKVTSDRHNLTCQFSTRSDNHNLDALVSLPSRSIDKQPLCQRCEERQCLATASVRRYQHVGFAKDGRTGLVLDRQGLWAAHLLTQIPKQLRISDANVLPIIDGQWIVIIGNSGGIICGQRSEILVDVLLGLVQS